MKVLLLSGSPRPMSRTLLAAALVAELLRRETAHVDLWDLAVRPLPFADPGYHSDPAAHPDPTVRELVHLAAAADAFVFASPVYHNSYSGVLKNALDHLSIGQFMNKPVGLIAFGGSLAAVQVCDHLRIVARGLLAIAVPTQMVAISADFGSDEDGKARLDNPDLIRRARRMAHDLTMFAQVTERSTV